MAIRVSNAFPDWNTDAPFRAWLTEFIASMVAIGWVQTADTGQINPATAVHPAENATAGFVIFRMNDALQAAAPVFAKFVFDGYYAPGPSIILTVATGTDGAGNMTGRVSPSMRAAASNGQAGGGNSGALYGAWYWSGSSSRVAAWLHDRRDNSVLDNMAFFIERTHDANGADTNEGAMIVMRCPGQPPATDMGWKSYFLAFEAARTVNPYWHLGPACVVPRDINTTPAADTAVDGPDTGVFPWRIPSRRGAESPMKGLVSVMGADAAWDAIFPILHYGADHVHRVAPSDAGLGANALFASMAGYGGSGNPPANWARIAMLWE